MSLALLIELFSGITTRIFLKQRIFDPWKCTTPAINFHKKIKARMVPVHKFWTNNGNLSKILQPITHWGNTIYGGTMVFFSSAADYMKFLPEMLLNKGEFKGKYLLSPPKPLDIMKP